MRLVSMMTFALAIVGCNSYTATPVLEGKLKSNCELSAECQISINDDTEYYDFDDETAYREYLVESCVDEYHDGLYVAKQHKCGGEYRAMMKCYSDNYIDSCDYDFTDPNDIEDYNDDVTEVQEETCFTAAATYSVCMNY